MTARAQKVTANKAEPIMVRAFVSLGGLVKHGMVQAAAINKVRSERCAYLACRNAHDAGNGPGTSLARLAGPKQILSIARNIRHNVLPLISGSGRFTAPDWFGLGQNLEEYRLEEPVFITLPDRPGDRQTGGLING